MPRPRRSRIVQSERKNPTTDPNTEQENVQSNKEQAEIMEVCHPGTSGEAERKRKAKNNISETYKIKLQNRYTPLSDTEPNSEDEISEDEEPEDRTKENKAADSQRKMKPPPPLVLHGTHKHADLVALVKQSATNPFYIKYTNEGPMIHLNTFDDRAMVLEVLKNKKLSFHTFTDKNIKTKAVVIRGLSHETTTNILLSELTAIYKLNVIKCVPMKTKKWPLHLIIIPSDVPYENLIKITNIDSTRVTWERYTTTRRITQCKNCQKWGHATDNCFAKPNCLKCAGPHITRECTKSISEPAKCVNCKEAHPANATVCPVFQNRKQWLDERAATRRPPATERPRKFAPAPATNPWARNGPPTANAAEFPPLPSRARTAESQQQPQHRRSEPPVTTLQQRGHATSAVHHAGLPETDAAAFHELGSVMRRINALINVHEVLQKMKNFAAQLEATTDQEERTLIACRFYGGFGG